MESLVQVNTRIYFLRDYKAVRLASYRPLRDIDQPRSNGSRNSILFIINNVITTLSSSKVTTLYPQGNNVSGVYSDVSGVYSDVENNRAVYNAVPATIVTSPIKENAENNSDSEY